MGWLPPWTWPDIVPAVEKEFTTGAVGYKACSHPMRKEVRKQSTAIEARLRRTMEIRDMTVFSG